MERETSELITKPRSNIERLSDIEWQPYQGHKNKSSLVYVDPDRNYLKKAKSDRSERKRDHEFFNLVVWNQLFAKYNEKYDTNLFVPDPYWAQGENIVMEYVGDDDNSDLGHILATGALVEEQSLSYVVKELGKLAKIMDNEGLRHNDLGLRHILLEDEGQEAIYVIDLERSLAGVSGPNGEVRQLVGKVGETRRNRDIERSFGNGYQSLPEDQLLDEAIEDVESLYGDVKSFL